MHADHFPWHDAMLIVPGAPTLPPPTPTRFVKFGDAMICTRCQLDARYCRGHAQIADLASKDGAAGESLAKRIKDCQGGR